MADETRWRTVEGGYNVVQADGWPYVEIFHACWCPSRLYFYRAEMPPPVARLDALGALPCPDHAAGFPSEDAPEIVAAFHRQAAFALDALYQRYLDWGITEGLGL